jgi:hypothetical protein
MTKEKPKQDLNILGNLLDKLDKLAERYRSTKSPEDLVKYILFRDKVLELYGIVWLDSLVDSNTAWMLMCYEASVTDGLGVFPTKAVPQPEFVQQLKEWRESIREKA